MFARLLSGLRARREARELERHAIPDALWDALLARHPFIKRRSTADLAELRRLSSLFLARKEFHGVGGFEVSDEVALAVAAQACLPILKLGLDHYDGFVGIVMHAGEVVARRSVVDEDGIVHEYDEELAGEAMEGGPLMLAWSAVAGPLADTREGVFNVVIHEFAHVLDLRDGAADGVPLLPNAAARAQWLGVIEPVWQRFGRRIDRNGASCIDAYGAEGLDEFFAVATEAFFVTPEAMAREQPALYRLLAGYYRQDPRADLAGADDNTQP
ncbi:MAG: zinc-dependent peptidase [Paucibacter sp.]|nr:zinc-dependent peptidase [Roseateles sp.]